MRNIPFFLTVWQEGAREISPPQNEESSQLLIVQRITALSLDISGEQANPYIYWGFNASALEQCDARRCVVRLQRVDFAL